MMWHFKMTFFFSTRKIHKLQILVIVVMTMLQLLIIIIRVRQMKQLNVIFTKQTKIFPRR